MIARGEFVAGKKKDAKTKTGAKRPQQKRAAVIPRKTSRKTSGKRGSAPPEYRESDAASLIESLHTHQIELEMQNEELRRAQEGLEASRSKYSDLYDFSPAGYFTFDKGGLILEVNLTGASLLGSERADLLNRVFTVFVVKDLDVFYHHRNQVFETGKRQICELELKRKDGTVFNAVLESILSEDRLCHTVINDVTERKRMEEALRKSEERYRNLFNAMDEGFCIIEMIFDAKGRPVDYRFLETNAAFERQTGLHEAEGKLMRELAPAHEEHWFEIYGKIASTGEPARFVDEARALNRWYDVYAYRVGRPENRQVAIIFNDISGHKRAEDALRESERRVRERAEELAAMLEAAPTPVIIVHDPDSTHMTGNRAADELLRQPHGAEVSLSAPPEVKPLHFRAIKDGRELTLDELPAQRAARGEHVQDFEFSLVFDDGTTRHLLGYGTPLLDEHGQPRGAVHVLVDITDRKRAEEAVKESEEQFHTLADSIPNLAWWANGDGYITWYNQRWYDYTGTTPEQMEGWGWQSVHDPEVLPNVLEQWNNSIKTGKPFDMVFPLRGADGVFRPFLTRVMPVYDQDGKVVRWFGTNTDISEQRKNEDALRASEARYRSFIEVTGQLAWTTNAKGEVVEDMPSWRAYTGQTYDEIKGWGWSKALHPDDLAHTTQRWKEAVTSKNTYEVEYRIRQHDGIYRHFMARGIPVFNRDGRLREWVGTCIDITERKRAEKALEQALAQLEIRVQERTAKLVEQSRILESFFRHTQTCLVFLDREFNFIRVNEAYARACGRDVADFEGHNHFALYPSDELKGEFQRVVDTKEPYSALGRPFEFPDHPEWGVTYWDLVVAPILDSDGEVELLVFSLLDVTERKRAEEEINSLNKELERRVKARTAELESVNRELEAFSYTVSHDLKAPLRSIEGFSRALIEDFAEGLDATGKDYLNRITVASLRMNQLIEAMLTMARLTRRELSEKPVNLSEVAGVIAYELKKKEPERQVEFVTAEKMMTNGDVDTLRIVIENLLNNAWKFTGKHPSATIEFGFAERGGKTVYFVRDDGAGFDIAYADKLFKPFQRLHAEAEFPGLGIGLAICKKIIERHGGKIWAEGKADEGATFYFTLE